MAVVVSTVIELTVCYFRGTKLWWQERAFQNMLCRWDSWSKSLIRGSQYLSFNIEPVKCSVKLTHCLMTTQTDCKGKLVKWGKLITYCAQTKYGLKLHGWTKWRPVLGRVWPSLTKSNICSRDSSTWAQTNINYVMCNDFKTVQSNFTCTSTFLLDILQMGEHTLNVKTKIIRTVGYLVLVASQIPYTSLPA